MLIEHVRVGSHHEYMKWNQDTNELDIRTRPKKGYSHRVVEDYKTFYHDCLVSKEWLREHEHTIPEPVIEIKVSGKTLSVNGNYKPGIIKEFVRSNKK